MVMFAMFVALYCRRSVDPADLGVSVAVQERNARKYAAERWPDLPVKAYVDNDLSAASPTVTRPRYQRLIEDVRVGRVAQVVVREQSRLTRQPAEWEALCVALQLAGIDAVHQTQGGPVSVTEGSRLPGRIMAVVDAEYVEQVRVKVRSALAANAEEGRPHGRAGYGYRMVTIDGRPALEPDPDTAPIAARMVAEIASGASLGVVADRLNREGVPTPRNAAEWGRATVRTIVTSDRLIGQRSHLGRTTAATWPAIVDRGVWLKAQSNLGENKPGTTRDKRRRYLLTGGIARCAGCDQPLISATTPKKDSRPLPSYRCQSPTRNDLACGACSILADRLEGHVIEKVTAWLDDPAILGPLNDYLTAGAVDTEPIRAELAIIDDRLATLAERWARGDLVDLEHAAARRVLHDDRKALMGQLAAAPVEPITVDEVLATWRDGHHRQIIAAIVDKVAVAGAGRNPRLPVEDRVQIQFRV